MEDLTQDGSTVTISEDACKKIISFLSGITENLLQSNEREAPEMIAATGKVLFYFTGVFLSETLKPVRGATVTVSSRSIGTLAGICESVSRIAKDRQPGLTQLVEGFSLWTLTIAPVVCDPWGLGPIEYRDEALEEGQKKALI